MKKIGHVISSTHWDREWYLTVENYRFRLVKCLDRVIDNLNNDPAWTSFFCDGQTRMIHDYLTVKPGQLQTIHKLVKAGRLLVGPWCVQPDEQIICGEAAIRNLLLGHQEARELGGVTRHGYLADDFGHVSQTPQILRGFGIDTTAFWRGYDEDHVSAVENIWRGADGSAVLAILLPRSYTNAVGYGPGTSENHKLNQHLPKLIELSLTGQIVLCDGTDHCLPSTNLAADLQEMRDKLGLDEIKHSSWPEVIQAVRDAGCQLPELAGELLYAPGLDSTGSNRVNQKQANMRCENLLTAYAEPLAVMAGTPYPKGFLKRAWTMMINNAAHDSIGGAHTDKVARDVIQRYERVKEIAKGVAAQAMDDLCGTASYENAVEMSSSIAVYNPTPRKYSGVIGFSVDIPDKGRDSMFEAIFKDVRLNDGDKSLPVHVLDNRASHRPYYGDRRNPLIQPTRTLKCLAHVADIPAMGIKTFKFTAGISKQLHSILTAGDEMDAGYKKAKSTADIAPEYGILQNEFFKVAIKPNGTFDLETLSSGRQYKNLNLLHDEQDAGNQYAFVAARNKLSSLAEYGSMNLVLNSPLRAVWQINTIIETVDERTVNQMLDRRLGNDMPRVKSPLTIEIGLSKGSHLIDIAVEIDNHGAGHRLRTSFPVTGTGLRVNSVFDLVNRSPEYQAEQSNGITPELLAERPSSYMQGFLAADDLILAGRGLYEYKHLPDSGKLDLTLFRSSGTINYDFEAWGSAASGYLPGKHRIEYAVAPVTESTPIWDLLPEVEIFLKPVYCRQYPGNSSLTLQGPELNDPRLFFSALKCREESESTVFRFCNVSEDTVETDIRLGRKYRIIRNLRIDETPLEVLAKDTDHLKISVPPKKIITWELQV